MNDKLSAEFCVWRAGWKNLILLEGQRFGGEFEVIFKGLYEKYAVQRMPIKSLLQEGEKPRETLIWETDRQRKRGVVWGNSYTRAVAGEVDRAFVW